MKKTSLIFAVAVAGLCMAVAAGAADAVQPESCTITNLRGQAQERVSGVDYYRGTSLLLTNCVMYSGTTTNARQRLSGVTIEVRVGTTETNIAYAGSVVSTNLGTWWATVAVPDLAAAWVQVKITDGSTNVYIYPWKTLSTLEPLE